jgi:NAD(P)-dependent dehydrogenase (short-subunit alcohol dehydrogenase family)
MPERDILKEGAAHAPIGMLQGKVAVITGAGSGIGKACARVFVREGAQVLAVDISGNEAAVAEELGPAAAPCRADVSQEDAIEAMFAAAVRTFGRVDAVLNVAGTQAGRTPEVTLEEYEQMTAVNLRGVLLSCKHAVRTMVPTGGGAIVNFSSVGAINAEERAPIAYSAAKAGVHALTKAFAINHARQGVRANVVAPGFTLTELTRKAVPEVLAEMGAKAAMGRAGEAHEPAEVAAFLASDRASYVTGAIIPVDGGWSARLA